LISYQGVLTDDLGDPITSATTVEFRLWDMASGGNELWMESQLVMPDADGLFEILLGEATPIPDSALDADSVFLGITLLPDAEMAPRTRMAAIAYSFRVGSIDGAAGGTITSPVSIGEGHSNSGFAGFVAGDSNTVSGDRSSVTGGLHNTASGENAIVAGGSNNSATFVGAAVGGGDHNSAYGIMAHVGGGQSNGAYGDHSTIGGGYANYTTGIESVVGGGSSNHADFIAATVSGGARNVGGGVGATVAGGADNEVTDNFGTVSGGEFNVASGQHSMVPGGTLNEAGGEFSFAAGYRAKAYGSGIFIWADSQDEDFEGFDDDQFLVRAQGGIWLGDESSSLLDPDDFIGTSTGAHLTWGGDWTNSSDVNKKENFTELDRDALLEKIATLPITEWNYKNQGPSVKHIGPMAQDFRALFDLGADDTSISTIDPAGIALAAIQGLMARNDQLEQNNQQMQDDIAELKALIKTLAAQQR